MLKEVLIFLDEGVCVIDKLQFDLRVDELFFKEWIFLRRRVVKDLIFQGLHEMRSFIEEEENVGRKFLKAE